jgi:orotidine-5'-phosphate decarboxylase
MGCKIFLDLKLHDIPNTVEKAMRNLAELGVEITNVHAGGGIKMMEAARRGLDSTEQGKKTELIAVTMLTSVDQEIIEKELLIKENLAEVVKTYALNAKAAGLQGVVCSPLEAPIIKELGLISVTPGIRFADNSVNDQKRVATPDYAKELGATYIVVGRAITGAADPVAAYKRCVKEFC